MFPRHLALLIAGIALFFGTPAMAEWHKAESDYFVVYADSRADDLKNFAEKLERFHAAMELETGRRIEKPSPSNRMTVYFVGSRENLRELYGDRNSSVAGFYLARATGPVAFVPNIKIKSGGTDFSFTILLHEYAHHFLIGSSRHAMPRWLSEGSAEYFASAKFNADGSVDMGLPNNQRAREISQADPVSLRELLDYDLYTANKSRRYDAYYGRAWLLFHYLAFNGPRNGQLERYWAAVTSGHESTAAAQAVFGDLDQLEDELFNYGRQRRMPAKRFGASEIAIGDVTVSKLSKGHAAAMDVIIRSKRGVDQESAGEVLADARLVAEEFPNDAHVMSALAEAEFDAGNNLEAVAAADRAIAIDAAIPNAYVQKGFALFEAAKNSDDIDAAYEEAMEPFIALNAIEPNHTQPLVHFYRSYTRRGVSPSSDARHALERASQLAPFDHSLSFDLAVMFAYEGKTDLAAIFLGPVAANPHGGSRASLANALRLALLKAPTGVPFDAQAIIAAHRADQDGNKGDAE